MITDQKKNEQRLTRVIVVGVKKYCKGYSLVDFSLISKFVEFLELIYTDNDDLNLKFPSK